MVDSRRMIVAACLVALIVVACRPEASQTAADAIPTVVDSAGILILESHGPSWQLGEGWRLATTPALSLGSVGGDGAEVFGHVVDVASMGDDHIIVADALASEVRIFSADGRHLRTIGRSGEGPGEFLRIASIQVLGDDTLAVFDNGARRLSRFLLSGRLLDERQLSQLQYQGAPVYLRHAAFLASGAIATREGRDFSGQGEGLTRDTAYLLVVDSSGMRATTIDAVPGLWTLRHTFNGTPLFGAQPLSSFPSFTVLRDTVYFISGEFFEVRKVTEAGLAAVLRRSAMPRLVQQLDRDRVVDRLLESVPPPEQAGARAMDAGRPYPERLPAYQNILVDPDGNVWAEHFESPGGSPGPGWDVFSANGQYLGVVENPVRMRFLEVGREHVLGVWTDEFDVEYVRLYRLEK